MSEAPALSRELLRPLVGEPWRGGAVHRGGSSSRVWRIEGPRGAVFLKQLASSRAWRAESGGLRAAASVLHAVGVDVPIVHTRDAEGRWLVLSALPGASPAPEQLETYARAGHTLLALRSLPPPADPLPLDEAIRRRLAGASAAAEGLVAPEIVEAVRQIVGDARAFRGVPRVMAHRDFGPHNWLVHGERLGLIDFEHSGPDAPEADLVKVCAGPNPAAYAALVDPMGGPPTGAAQARLHALLALFGLQGLSWAARHADPTWRAHAHRALALVGVASTPASTR